MTAPPTRRQLLTAGAAIVGTSLAVRRPVAARAVASLPSPPSSTLDDAAIQHLVDAVSLPRLMTDIETLAATPRHHDGNPVEIAAAADYVADEFESAGLAPQRLPVTVAGATLPVVWTEVGGSGPRGAGQPTFVLVGHYDTVRGSPGADDNASGVAAVLEAARVFVDVDLPSSVVLAGLPFEELGPPYPASLALGELLLAEERHLTGMLSAEMLGYALPEPDDSGDPGDYLLLLGNEGAEELVATFADAATRFADFRTEGGTFPPETEFIDRSDHAAFHALGVPAMFATDGANFRTPHYHQASDTPENIVQPFLHGCVKTIVGGIALHA